MPQECTDNEHKPPGGSSFGHHFHKDAFGSSIFPKPGLNTDVGQCERRTQRRDHKSLTHGGDKHFASALAYAVGSEAKCPSRLRKALDGYTSKKANAQPTLFERAQLRTASSAPDLMTIEAPEIAHRSYGPGNPDDDRRAAPASSGAPTMAPTTRYYPNATGLRGNLKLCDRRAMDWGYDPDIPARRCPFWEAEVHRFGKVASHPDARPRTPDKAQRWKREESWNDPSNHAALKVTHSIPRMPRDT